MDDSSPLPVRGRTGTRRVSDLLLDGALVLGMVILPFTLPFSRALEHSTAYLEQVRETTVTLATNAISDTNDHSQRIYNSSNGLAFATFEQTKLLLRSAQMAVRGQLQEGSLALERAANPVYVYALGLTGPEVALAEPVDYFTDPIFATEVESQGTEEVTDPKETAIARLPELEDRPPVVQTAVEVFTPTEAVAASTDVTSEGVSTEDDEIARSYISSFSAYTSLAALTDASPWITADGTTTHFGVVANNCLPFGTRVRLPDLYGNQVFVVHDRMNSRYGCEKMDVWLPSYDEAIQFGIRRSMVEVLN